MRYALLLLLFPFLFTSCRTYQYFALTGENIRVDSSFRFAEEQDSLRVEYDFNGNNGPVAITIVNKMTRPVFVNWKRSALIMGDEARSYYSPDIRINGWVDGTSVNLGSGVRVQSGSVTGVGRQEEGMDFIPPGSRKTRVAGSVTNGPLRELSFDNANRKPIEDQEGQPKVRYFNYESAGSPLRFRSYMSFCFSETGADAFTREHRFYVSEVYKALQDPGSIAPIQGRGDRFYTSRATGVGAGLAVLAGLGVVLVAATGD